MKKILFIISNLETGGVSKSLTSLMNVIDRRRYDISLMVLSPHGKFTELLPPDLPIVSNPIWEGLVNGPKGILHLLKLKHPFLACRHALRLFTSVFSKPKAALMIAKLMPPLKEKFDVAIDFNGQQQLYYMVDRIPAKTKITFFHSDYSKWPYYYAADKKYFPKTDHIFTVSQQCVDSLKSYFPEQSHKIALMENITSLPLIKKMSRCEIADNLEHPSLLTIGHVCENKGIVWAIKAASILKKRNIDFHWYFIGSVDKPKLYKRLIAENDVADRMTFLGVRANPYPYIRQATLIVHPSKFEGRSIALDEAKLLCKPVVVTNFSTVGDQFTNNVNASICEMNPTDIADKIEELLCNSDLRNKYKKNLETTCKDNSDEINKLYAIFDKQ